MKNIRVVIADDHQLFRSGIESLLTNLPGIVVVGGADDKKSLMQILSKAEADVLLLDISLPSASGLDLLVDLKHLYPELKCIMLTMHEELRYVKESLRKGAYGYLLKDTDKDELYNAIQHVAAGKKHFKNRISDLLVEDISGPADDSVLTDREREIIRMVADGKITKEIAESLFISVRTVETHRSRIMKKLGASNASDMIRMALERKLI